MTVGFQTLYLPKYWSAEGPYFFASISDYNDDYFNQVYSANVVVGNPNTHYSIRFAASCASDEAFVNSDNYLSSDENPSSVSRFDDFMDPSVSSWRLSDYRKAYLI